MGQALEHEPAKIDIRARGTLERDLHHAALHGGRFVIALDIVAAHHVEDHVGALAVGRGFGRRDEILGTIIDGLVPPQPNAGFAFFRASRRGLDPPPRRHRAPTPPRHTPPPSPPPPPPPPPP